MRKLASVQRIISINPIEGADAIEKVGVLGWEVVVKKGEFSPGDLVVYCEIDSVLPERPEFDFLKSKRIKTIRLRGQISQGIVFPVNILPEDVLAYEGMDCTEILGIIKYEPAIPANLAGVVKGVFPSFIPKTDETRVQVLQEVLNEYAGEVCYITEKLDGSSVTFYFKDGIFGVCSRNMELLEDNKNTFWKVAREMQIEERLRKINKNIAIQGELIGEGIQGNKYKLKGQTCKFFNAFDIDAYKYYNWYDFAMLAEDLSLPVVPIVSVHYILENEIPNLIKLATIKSQLADVWAEGIVIRPKTERLNFRMSNLLGNNGRVSFKVINPEFLLKYQD